ncbi:serine/threonine-protein phosphatase 6 regulatory ankyrin repeat subunit B-like isoform X2 [Haliotis rufescens]|uniref:serine/threonine-protein phosphatase 6 regulatory ankyrin repeat subunit B-like isoform X2 n=1 Tax=Haliotis rufescens TaxID=6454 RepID=UPI00201EF648|nr:serine/threonine-protein phosphatase 6 regulatory ankyrin repeat subunit B-like isoform X2 [Haliotis rufescens]
MVHTDPDCPHVDAARGQFSPQMEGEEGGQIEEDAITSSEEEQEVPNEQKPVVIYTRGAKRHADNVDAFFRNNGRSIQRFECDNAERFTEALKTDCTRMIVLIDEEFSQLMEDEYRMFKRVFNDLIEAEKEVQLVNYLDDDEIFQEVKYKLPGAMRKNIIPNTRFLNSTNGYVALEDHATSVAQVGDNNNIEVRLDGGNIRAQQVGRSNTFTASSGPSIQGYELTIKTPDTDYEVCVEIKRHIDNNINNINISLKPHNTRVESTSLGSVIIRVAVEPGTKLGPVWLREVITKILSEDIIAKLPKGTRMEVSISASLPLTPLDVDIFEFEDENEAAHWMTEYTSDIHRKDETGRSMLHQASRIGNRAAVIFSLKSGCVVNDQDCQGNTPLHYAVLSGETGASVSRLLVEGGASIDVVNNDGCTSLHLAVTENNLEMVELFARKFGAKESNPTANQKIEISSLIHFLVKQGADVNALNRQNLTPLQVAASSQRFDVIVALLTEGADANVVHKSGQTPLHGVYGLNKPNQKTVEVPDAYRLKKQLRVEPVTQLSGDTCKPDDNRASKAPSSVLDIPDSEGNTPLQSALNSYFIQAAFILLNAGANANTKNKEMDTPIHTVTRNTNIENTTSEHDAVVKIIECSRDVNVTDKQGNTPLMLAVEQNKNISPLLKAGADVNAQNIHGDTPLMIAVKHNSRMMVKTSLEAGSEVCTSNTQGGTAADRGWEIAVNVEALLEAGADVDAPINERQSNTEQLIAAGADVNVQDKEGNTPLMMAVKKGWNISPLLTTGANVNSQNRLGETALHLVSDHRYEHAPINERQSNTEQLIVAGADVSVQDKDGNTPLMKAVKTGWDISPLLTAGANVNSQNRLGETALHLVSDDRYEHAPINERQSNTEQLIAAGADVNVQDKDGNTPLMKALKKGWNISPLLTAGANVNSQNSLGETALHLASHHRYEHAPINERQRNTEQLIAAGADVNAQDIEGNTPLMTAVKTGRDISPLLTAGADVTSQNGLGKTALHLVSEHQHDLYGAADINKSVTEQLIDAGADVNVQDKDGNTPLIMAVKTGRDISPLLKAGADVTSQNELGKTALHLVSEHRYCLNVAAVTYKSVIEQLIDAGADVNVQDKDGNTPLMMAAMTGWDRRISPLLKAGADVTSKNKLGKTALHLVSKHQHPLFGDSASHKSVTELIAAGADINVQDEDGNTPLMMAAMTGWDISPLLTAGADVTTKNGLGETALHLVREKKNYLCINKPINEGQSNAKQLIAAGADVNAQDEDGNTPLHTCVKNNDYRSVKALLSVLRSDVNITNRNGKSALHLAEDAVSPTHFGILGISGKDHNYLLVHLDILMIFKGIKKKQYYMQSSANTKTSMLRTTVTEPL